MSMFSITVAIKDDKLAALLQQYPDRLRDALKKAMTEYTIRLQAMVKNKLSDDVLHVRSGTLRRSINRTVEDVSTTAIRGIVGTNIRYAAVHEYGFVGTVMVPEHTRRVTSVHKSATTMGKAGFGKMGEKRMKYINGIATVRAHTMKMNIPERSFLRSSLHETIDDAREVMKYAVKQAMIP